MVRLAVLVTALCAAATSPVEAAEPWLGRWAMKAESCGIFGTTKETAPLVVWEKSLSWVMESCSVGKLYRIGDDAHIQAHCSGSAGTVPISLKPKADRMIVVWNNATLPELRRCK